MDAKRSSSKANKYQMTWQEVFRRLHQNITPKLSVRSRVWGIPRGGVWVAAMTGVATDDIQQADIIVDDIIDTGRTAEPFRQKFNKPILCLVDKKFNAEDKKLPWIVFPWEKHQGESHGPAEAIVRLLEFIDEDPNRDGLRETPMRVLQSFEEMTEGSHDDPKQILQKQFSMESEDESEMIVVRGIRFASLCEHHLLPFTGEVGFGYIPNEHLVGLSKIPRLIHCFAKRLQVQERMTSQIANSFNQIVKPLGVGVVVRAHHSCMGCRGVKQPDAEMITSSMLGAMRDNPSARLEILELIK